MNDLVILVADGNMESLLRGLLNRIPVIENLRPFSYEIFKHPKRDPGICNNSADFLRVFLQKYKYAIVICDYEGCGKDTQNRQRTREDVELAIETDLSNNGWTNASCAIVVNPEIENWIWVNPIQMGKAIGWKNPNCITRWARQNGWLAQNAVKPVRPKEAFEAALYLAKTPRSSSLYKKIAETASYRNCIDPAFLKFISFLRNCFQ